MKDNADGRHPADGRRPRDWIWDVIVCPECGNDIRLGENEQALVCTNDACGYRSERTGRAYNLLPLEIDRFKQAENDFRTEAIERYADAAKQMTRTGYTTYKLLNVLTDFFFTSEYLFFRDTFAKKYNLEGRGLEIGGATGQHSGFLKLFYPATEMVMSDVAPVNIALAEELADLVGFQTDYFVVCDAEQQPFRPGSFDFMFSSGMLHHLGDLQRALRQGHCVLKPGGRWYIINELSIGAIPRLYWNSRWGEKGKWAEVARIRENSYTLQEWKRFFTEEGTEEGFRIVDMYFHTNPAHKLRNWQRSAYYAFISRLPDAVLKMGIPCEVCFVLEKAQREKAQREKA